MQIRWMMAECCTQELRQRQTTIRSRFLRKAVNNLDPFKTALGMLGVLAIAITPGEARGAYPVSRGRQVLLNRGLQLQSLVFFDQPGVANIDINLWKSANFTTINFWEAQNPLLPSQMPAGTQWSRQYVPPAPANYLYAAELPYVKNLASLQYADELPNLSPSTLNSINTAYRNWNANYPNTIAFTNFSILTSDADLANYIDATHPDMLSFDLYPQRYGTPLADWYSNMQKYRAAALAGYTVNGVNSGPLPYAQYLNTCRTSPTGSLPTPSFIRLQQNASWAFGYTFTTAFVYNAYNDSDVSAAMFTGKGDSTPTPVFDYVKETNRQSRNLGPALIRLVSTDVRFIPGRHPNSNPLDVDGDANSLPDRLTAGSAGTGWGHEYLKNVSVTNIGNSNTQTYLTTQRKLAGDVIFGFFNVLDEAFDGPAATGETYFMVVNGLTETDGAAPADTRQRITLNFNFGTSGINSLQRMSRDTGQVEAVPLVSDGGASFHLDLTLDGGAGDLFKFNTGAPFVSTLASTWQVNGSGDWNVASNWSVGVPNAVDARAQFASSASTRTIFSESAVTVGNLRFDSSSTYQIAGNGSLSIDVSTGAGSISVMQGTHKINLPLFINDNTVADIAAGATLKISDPMTLVGGSNLTKTGNGTLSIEAPVLSVAPASLVLQAGTTTVMADLGNHMTVTVRGGDTVFSSAQHLASLSVAGGRMMIDNNVVLSTKFLAISNSGVIDLLHGKLVIDYTGFSVLEDVQDAIASGRLTSTGVIVCGEASDLFSGASGVFAGETLDSTSVIAALTIMGDASLDGVVTSADFNQFSAHFGTLSGGRWTQGDFDGDGKVTTTDFNILADNYGGALQGTGVGVVVPEPRFTSFLLVGVAMSTVMARRSRTHSPAME
jgi:hypothetical protein